MSTTIYKNNYYKSTTTIDSQTTKEQEAISSLSTEIISITSKLNNLNAELTDMKIAINKLKIMFCTVLVFLPIYDTIRIAYLSNHKYA